MQLEMDIYRRAATISWLSDCGANSRRDFGLAVRWIEDREVALQSMFSPQWADAMTLALGCLTSHLSKQDYDAYGHWNALMTQSRARLDAVVGARLAAAIKAGAWADSLARLPLPSIGPGIRASLGVQLAHLLESKEWERSLSFPILVEVNLAALETTYRHRFSKAPGFFETLFEVYSAGRLPCGWDGDLDNWPEGKLNVY